MIKDLRKQPAGGNERGSGQEHDNDCFPLAPVIFSDSQQLLRVQPKPSPTSVLGWLGTRALCTAAWWPSKSSGSRFNDGPVFRNYEGTLASSARERDRATLEELGRVEASSKFSEVQDKTQKRHRCLIILHWAPSLDGKSAFGISVRRRLKREAVDR